MQRSDPAMDGETMMNKLDDILNGAGNSSGTFEITKEVGPRTLDCCSGDITP